MDNGWITFLDIDGNGALDAGVDQLIRTTVIPRVATVAWGGMRNITPQGGDPRIAPVVRTPEKFGPIFYHCSRGYLFSNSLLAKVNA